ncbi:unnamed protein product, partial [Ixodes persulcatus]
FVSSAWTRRTTMISLSEKVLLFWDWRWLTTAIVFLLSYHVFRFYRKVSKYPRGPVPLPFVGNLLSLRNETKLYKKAEEWSRQYGDPFTLWMGEKPTVILNSYQVVREAFVDKRHDFAGRFRIKLGEQRTQGNHDILFEDYNPTWKALRKVALTAVRKYAISESLETLCTEVVDAYVDSLEKGPNTVDSKYPFMFIIFNIVGTSVFGTKFDKESHELTRMRQVNQVFTEVAPNGLPSDIVPWLGILYRKTEKQMEALFTELFEILDGLYKRAAGSYVPGTTGNFTHSMLAAREEALQHEKSDAQYLTEANMVQILIDIFGGATESSIGTMRWLCLTLARRTDIQKTIQQEIEDNIGSSPPTLKDRDRLPYTVACIYETLRVYPVGPLGFPHNTCCDTQAGGKFIPKNTGILYNIHAVNHDPALWKDPDVFRPERFLDPTTGKLNLEGQPPLLSFGLGPRTCPGEKLGQMDIFYVLVRLLQRVSFGVPDGTSSTDIKQLASSVFLMPAVQEIVLTRMN